MASTTCAIIAEYNPFHNGHAYHLRRAKELSGDDKVLVLLSSFFTQRGEGVILSPYARAEMALRCGADVVLAAPCLSSVREADTYALHNVLILNQLPAVTHLAFGAETDDLDLLKTIATILEEPNDKLDAAIRRYAALGASHAEALSSAVEEMYGFPAQILSSPNNILAVCYLRALLRTGSKIIPLLIPRAGEYHALKINPLFPSAASLRRAILRGDWASIRSAMPPDCYTILTRAAMRKEIFNPLALDQMLQYRLATISRQQFRSLPDAYEGIENYFLKQNRDVMCRQDMLQHFSTRRYSQSRVSRLLCHMLLGTNVTAWRKPPAYVHFIGCRSSAAAALGKLPTGSSLGIIYRRTRAENGEVLQKDRQAEEIWRLCAGMEKSRTLRRTIIF
ncbi:MAG: nucleotidyltransferase family protein [Clostridiales bacterium]|nr:nucleotidyltransferase family protein [Clostridiales bacterium]